MRANSRTPQHERSRRSQGESNGRFEIRQIAVSYYIDTRSHRRRRLTFQESLRAVAAINARPAPSSPPSLTSRPDDAQAQRGIGRDVNDEVLHVEESNVEVSTATNTDSLTFSSIAASSALHDELLRVSCGCLDTLDEDSADSSSCGSHTLMATPAAAFANATIAGGTTAHSACSFADPAAFATAIDSVVQTTSPRFPQPLAAAQSWTTELDQDPKSRCVEAACGPNVASPLDTKYRSSVVRALSLITVRLGYRGAVSMIASSMTSNTVMLKPECRPGVQTMQQLVFPVQTGAWQDDRDNEPIMAILTSPLEKPSESKSLPTNWFPLTAA